MVDLVETLFEASRGDSRARLYWEFFEIMKGWAEYEWLEPLDPSSLDHSVTHSQRIIKVLSELPRPKGRGFLDRRILRRAIVDRRVMLSLTPDVSTHRLGGDFVAHRGHIISIRPQSAGPQRASHLGELRKHLPGRHALDDIHNPGRRQPRRSFQEQVNVVLHDFQLHDGHRPLRCDALQQVFQIRLPDGSQEPLAVFRNPHKVVLDIVPCAGTGCRSHVNILDIRKRLSSPADIESAGLNRPHSSPPQGAGFPGGHL